MLWCIQDPTKECRPHHQPLLHDAMDGHTRAHLCGGHRLYQTHPGTGHEAVRGRAVFQERDQEVHGFGLDCAGDVVLPQVEAQLTIINVIFRTHCVVMYYHRGKKLVWLCAFKCADHYQLMKKIFLCLSACNLAMSLNLCRTVSIKGRRPRGTSAYVPSTFTAYSIAQNHFLKIPQANCS